MKRLVLSIAFVSLSAASAMAGGVSFDLPRLDFPGQDAQVTQLCNPLIQLCGD